MSDYVPLYDEENEYINEDHIHEFAKALLWEELDDAYDTGSSGLNTRHNSISASLSNALDSVMGTRSGTTSPPQGDNAEIIDEVALNPTQRPDLITSKSDWYPLTNRTVLKLDVSETPPEEHQNGKKPSRTRKTKPKALIKAPLTDEFRASAAYTFLRWPVLFGILLWILFLCILYVSVRFYVALLEYYFTWVGERKKLRDKLRQSTSYEEWIENAITLDKYMNLDKWSDITKFSYYDSYTLKLTVYKLKSLRIKKKDQELLSVLQSCLKKNFAGIENRQLYSHRYYGTKTLVSKYVDEVVKSIDYISDSTDVTLTEKRKFFKLVLKNYGKTALCLSGGACFAYTHFGIIKALLDNNLLPRIISGTSGGGLIAALACTRTDEELHKLLVPQLARKITACEDPWYVWIPRWWKTGARFDSVSWARKSNFFTKGSTTFREAYKISGRKLNISTVPADPHSPIILCNDITSPDCIIWSTLLASSAVPGILNPVVLMMKNPITNEVTPFSFGSKWRDGSLRTDIPLDSLNAYYNVNFTVVSQVNPHISLFFFAPKGTVGRPVAMPRRRITKGKYATLRGGFIATALEQLFKLEITKWLKMIKTLDLLPHFLEQDWSNIWLQRFTGSVTIWPRNKLKDFWYILSDPTEQRMEEFILKGERCMYPRLLFIKNRLSIERAIERGRKAAKMSTDIAGSFNSRVGSPFDGSGIEVHDVNYEDDDEFGPRSVAEPEIESSDEVHYRTISPDAIPPPFTVFDGNLEDEEEDFDEDDELIDEDLRVEQLLPEGSGRVSSTETESIHSDEYEDEQTARHRRNTIQ